MEAFSDGVFAIAITLLVLEIGVPSDSGDRLLRAIVDEWPQYLAYAVSFATIGAGWVGHAAITDYLVAVDAVLLRLNLLFLMIISFLPFPTRLLAEYIGENRPERVAATIYGLTLLLAALLLSVLWRYGLRERLVRPDAADEEVQTLTKRLTPSLAGYVVLIGVGLFFPIVAVLGYLAISLFLLVPFGLTRHHRARA
jgi:uncharacterized membrane protein